MKKDNTFDLIINIEIYRAITCISVGRRHTFDLLCNVLKWWDEDFLSFLPVPQAGGEWWGVIKKGVWFQTPFLYYTNKIYFFGILPNKMLIPTLPPKLPNGR